MKKHSKALVFFAVSKQIPIVYSADRGRAEKISEPTQREILNLIHAIDILPQSNPSLQHVSDL